MSHATPFEGSAELSAELSPGPLAPKADGGPLGSHQIQQVGITAHQAIDKVVFPRHLIYQSALDAGQLQAIGLVSLFLQGRNFCEDYPTQELAGFAQFIGYILGGFVVAGDQPPQLVVLHQRNGEGRAHLHVVQVLNVAVVGLPQNGHDQVRGLVGVGIGGGDQIHRVGVGVGDHANPVRQKHLAGGLGHIRLGEVQPQVRFHVVELFFRQHFAVAVVVKLVQHHPVKAGDLTDLVDNDAAKVCQVGGIGFQLTDGGPGQMIEAEEGNVLLGQGGLQLHDQKALLIAVEDGVVHRVVVPPAAHPHLGGVHDVQVVVVQPGPELVYLVGVEQVSQGFAEHFFWRQSEGDAGVGAHLQYRQVRLLQNQQHPVGLHFSQSIDVGVFQTKEIDIVI